MQDSIFHTSPNGENAAPGDLSMRDVLAMQDKIPRENPDDTLDDERVQLVMRFKRKAEDSEKRKMAVERWKEADRFIDGDQWSETDLGKLDPHQSHLTINRVFTVQETRVALMTENLEQVEVLPRDAADDTFAQELDGFLIHEWERQGWSSVFATVLWQASAHSTAFIKTYWDVHAEGGRGAAKLEPVSNYDLFIHEKARIREGKLVAKYVIHRFELTRNEILQIYNKDIIETPPEVPRSKNPTQGDAQTSGLLGDDATDSIFMTGKPSTTAASDDSRAPEYVAPQDTYEVLECWYMDDEHVETEEYDDVEQPKTKRMYPNGRILTVCNGRLLFDAPNPLGFFPFVPITERPTISEIYPPSTINHIVGPQREYNKRRSQISDHAELCANPIKVISSIAAVEQDTHTNKPGHTFISMDAQSPDGGIRFLDPPPLGAEAKEGAVFAHQDIDEISSMHEVNRGEEPTQARSGVAIEHLKQSGRTRTSWHSSNVDVGLLQTYRNVISMYLDFVDDARKYRFTDPETLEQVFGEFNPQAHILPNRQKRIMEIEAQIQALEAQKLFVAEQVNSEFAVTPEGEATMAADEEVAAILQQIDQEVMYLLSEIQVVEQMPASDLVSFDISIQTGTRHLSLQALASLVIQLYEMKVITAETLLKRLQFPGWQKALNLKREEQALIAQAQQEMEEIQFERDRQLQREKQDQLIDLERERAETQVEAKEAEARGDIELQEEKAEDDLELERLKGEVQLRIAKAKAAKQTTKPKK